MPGAPGIDCANQCVGRVKARKIRVYAVLVISYLHLFRISGSSDTKFLIFETR